MKDGTFVSAQTAATHLRGEGMPNHIAKFAKSAVGKRITHVGYVVLDGQPWPCILLEDNSALIAQRDDEANGPGVIKLSTNDEKKDAILCQCSLKEGGDR